MKPKAPRAECNITVALALARVRLLPAGYLRRAAETGAEGALTKHSRGPFDHRGGLSMAQIVLVISQR